VADVVTLRQPPAFAGGRLLWWNRVLRAHAAHLAGGPEPLLLLDPSQLREADLRVDIVNANGDVVRLPAPEGGAFLDARARQAFSDALEDQLPPTAQQRGVVARLLPMPGVSLMDHALALWPTLFPGLRVRAADSRGGAEERGADGAGAVDTAPDATGWTWFGEVHRRTMRELGIDAELAAQGEAALVAAIGIPLEGSLGESVGRFRETVESECAGLRPLAEAVDPQLLGAWRRMRREIRSALLAFARSADRSGRNRAGLRGARLHQLAQGLRPLDLPQEEGLSLLAAASLFQLEIADADRYATRLGAGGSAESLWLDT
jgi:hypothetical protein